MFLTTLEIILENAFNVNNLPELNRVSVFRNSHHNPSSFSETPARSSKAIERLTQEEESKQEETGKCIDH